jgi:histidinol dehydrogenase
MRIINYNKLALMKEIPRDNVDMKMVRSILKDVKENGDEALKRYTLKYDGVNLERFKVRKTRLNQSFSDLDRATLYTIEQAAANLERFAKKQLSQLRTFEFEMVPGLFTGQRVIPIDRVGIYVPGGNYPLVSSLLMGAVPARIAGVKEIVVCTPPGKDGGIHHLIEAAAFLAGVDEVIKLGGVQAIGAMAFGSESIKPTDKIVGPGNRYVTAAKKEVNGQVGIEFIAGPSEVMIIADQSANATWIAADLLAQAEHDSLSVPIFVTPSLKLAQEVVQEINHQLVGLETVEIAQRSVKENGLIVLVDSLDQAVEYANWRAPEHLEIHLEDPEEKVEQFFNYGTIFIGPYSAEVLGDYTSGLNHTLPTARAARYTGGLSVFDYIKIQTSLRATKDGIMRLGKETLRFAQLEGLAAHARAIALRMEG